MKKLFNLLFSLALVIMCAFTLIACGSKEQGELSRVQIDVNPSIEMMVDENQNVVSVSALNDDASIVLSGEEIVGKNVEEATKMILEIGTETGYIVKGEVSVSNNQISISVSGDSEYAKKLADKIIKAGNDALEKSGVKAELVKINSITVEELRKVVLENSTFTKEEVDAMDEKQLLEALKVSRMETALLVTEELRKVYYEAKAYEIKFAEKEAVSKIIKNVDGVSKILITGYSAALQSYRNCISNLEELKYNTLISNDSLYQQTLKQVRDAKAKYLEQKTYVASLEAGDLKVNAEIELNNLKEAYEAIESALVRVGETTVKGFDDTINLLKEAEVVLSSWEEKLKDVKVEEELKAKTKEIEEIINNKKDKFFEEFEKTHKEDIEKANQDLINKKEELKKSILEKSQTNN